MSSSLLAAMKAGRTFCKRALPHDGVVKDDTLERSNRKVIRRIMMLGKNKELDRKKVQMTMDNQHKKVRRKVLCDERIS